MLRDNRIFRNFPPGAIPEIFSSCEAPINGCFSPIKSFHPFLLSGKPQTFSFYEAPKKICASKDFQFHPHKNCDIIKTIWGCSPLRMIFYSTKESIVSQRSPLQLSVISYQLSVISYQLSVISYQFSA